MSLSEGTSGTCLTNFIKPLSRALSGVGARVSKKSGRQKLKIQGTVVMFDTTLVVLAQRVCASRLAMTADLVAMVSLNPIFVPDTLHCWCLLYAVLVQFQLMYSK